MGQQSIHVKISYAENAQRGKAEQINQRQRRTKQVKRMRNEIFQTGSWNVRTMLQTG
jgi:hypothetical protein